MSLTLPQCEAHFLETIMKFTNQEKIAIVSLLIEMANSDSQIAYEEITGKAFDTESLNKASNMMALYYACIVANNESIDISFDQLLAEADAHDIKVLREAVIESFTDWCKSIDVDGKKKKGKGSKN